jgi:DNA-binding SARP family transcriptional activator/tetratricopeptide (TPR) repeat protein
MLRVRLFGGVEAHLDGRAVETPARRRAWWLFAWLALHPGLHGRGELAARFWPDVLDQSARASLRSALWALRRALGPAGDAYLVATGDRIGLDPGRPLWVDALEFEALAAEDRLEEALALCEGGPLLAGVDEDWALRASDAHRERLVEVLERLASAAEGRGDLEEAVRATRRQTALDPFGEEAHRRLMRRLGLAGDRPAALEVYARLVDRLRRELRLTPSTATRALAAEVRGADREGGAAAPVATAPAPAQPRADRGRTALAQRPPLVGRDRDLARLMETWRAARAGLGSAVVVSGEAGIGKTRLAAELAERARAEGACVAACAALDLGGTAPFGLWAELVRDLARDLSPPADAGWPAEVARLAPDLEGRAGWATPRRAVAPPELERARLFEAVVALVDWAGRDRPLLLVLEDVHAADGASLELAGYLARRLARTSRLMVLTMRDLPARAEVDALLAALRARGVLADEIALEPLPPEAIGRLARGVASLDADDVLRVIDASEGNPLLAVESARAIARGERTLSAGLRGAVRASARSLDEGARGLADLLAVAGRSVDHRELELLPLDDPAGAATAAIQAGLLVADDEGRIGYRHALLRDAVYLDLAEPRRARLHADVARMLGGREEAGGGPRAAEIARHLQLAHRGDLAVEQLARAAAEAQAIGAPAEAVAFLEEAARIAPADARVLLALAEAHAWHGRRAEAGATLERALASIGPRDVGALLDAHLRAGRWFRGALCDPPASLAAYRSALALLDRGAPGDPGQRANALVGAAWCEAVAGDLEVAERLLAEVERLLAAGGLDASIAHEAVSARAQVLLRRGRFLDASEPLIATGEAARLAGRLDRTYDCWINAATAMACAGEFAGALEIADRALAAMREAGLAHQELEVLAGRAHILARLGRLAEAAAAAAQERELAERLGDPALSDRADHDAGLIALAAGDHAAAETLLGAALRGGAAIGRARARLARAEALVHLGRLAEAEAELDATALEPLRPSDFPDTLVARLTRVEGLVAMARGDAALARRRLDEAAGLWRRRGAGGSGEQYVANLVDLGRPPVLGLVEPDLELRRLMTDLDALQTTTA